MDPYASCKVLQDISPHRIHGLLLKYHSSTAQKGYRGHFYRFLLHIYKLRRLSLPPSCPPSWNHKRHKRMCNRLVGTGSHKCTLEHKLDVSDLLLRPCNYCDYKSLDSNRLLLCRMNKRTLWFCERSCFDVFYGATYIATCPAVGAIFMYYGAGCNTEQVVTRSRL